MGGDVLTAHLFSNKITIVCSTSKIPTFFMRRKHLEGDGYENVGCMLVSCLALSPLENSLSLENSLAQVF
jgi:hypothetical protein